MEQSWALIVIVAINKQWLCTGMSLWLYQQPHIFYFLESTSYTNRKGIFKYKTRKSNGIYNEHHNLFHRATWEKIKVEYSILAKDWASLINRTPFSNNWWWPSSFQAELIVGRELGSWSKTILYHSFHKTRRLAVLKQCQIQWKLIRTKAWLSPNNVAH